MLVEKAGDKRKDSFYPISIPITFPDPTNIIFIIARLLGIPQETVTKTLDLITNTWDAQTLDSLLQGKVVITEAILNTYLTYQLKNNQEVDSLQVLFPNGNVQVTATTAKLGKVVLNSNLHTLRHSSNESVMILDVLDKQLPDKAILSWLASWVSLGVVARFFGPLEFGDGITVQVEKNRVTVNFRERLQAALPDSMQIFGKPLRDVVIIDEAKVIKGAVELSCKLDVIPTVRKALEMVAELGRRIVNKKA